MEALTLLGHDSKHTDPSFSGDSRPSWPKPQVCVEARGMSQGLQGLTKHSFLSRRPDRGDGRGANCNVDILMHMESGHAGFCLTRWWDREGRGILMDLGDQIHPGCCAPCSTTLLFYPVQTQLLSSACSGSGASEGRQKLSPAAPSAPQPVPEGRVTLARNAHERQRLEM